MSAKIGAKSEQDQKNIPSSRLPLRLVGAILVCLFISDAIVKFVLNHLPEFEPWVNTPVQSLFLVVVLFPILYFFSFRPMILEIEKSKRVEEDLQKAKDYAERIVDTVHEPLVVLDSSLKVMSANRSFYRRFRFSPMDIVNHPIYQIGNGQWNIKRLRMLLEEVTSKNSHIRDFEIIQDLQTIDSRVMVFNARRIFREDTKSIMILLAIEDITERKRAEEALLKAHQELERRVIERTAQLANTNDTLYSEILERKRAEDQLRKAHDELEILVKVRTADLERSNQDLAQFAYVASHDLQEPMRMVSSFVQLLAQRYKGKLDADADRIIHFAVNSANRMQELIKDLLAYSRVDSQGREFKMISCQEALDQALLNLRVAIKESGVTITFDPLPDLLADSLQLVQLFQNLIDNAIKYRSTESPKVHIGARREGGSWQFWVKDNGIGMEPRYYDKIFVIFQRLHNSEKYPGTGIGLSLCKKIVERHGGRIWVESKPQEGSTFYFTIPAKSV